MTGLVNKKRLTTILCVAMVAISAAIGWYIISNALKKDDNLELANATLGVMPGIDPDQRLKDLQNMLDKSMIAFSVNTNPLFSSTSGEGNLMLENPGNNKKLLTAQLVLSETEETLFESKAMVPGSYFESITLTKPLPAGEYDAVVYFKAYAEDTHEYIGQTGAQIKLTVEA